CPLDVMTKSSPVVWRTRWPRRCRDIVMRLVAPPLLSRAAALAFMLLLLSSCASRARSFAADAPRLAIPATVDEGLKAGEDESTRNRLELVLASPEIQQAIEEVAKAAAKGALDGLSSEETNERLASLTRTLVPAVVEALRAELASNDERAIRDTATTVV